MSATPLVTQQIAAPAASARSFSGTAPPPIPLRRSCALPAGRPPAYLVPCACQAPFRRASEKQLTSPAASKLAQKRSLELTASEATPPAWCRSA